MADNYAITAGSGTVLAADDISSVYYRRFKLSLGADGTAVDAVAGAGAVDSGTQRVTLASDDPAVAALAAISKQEDAAHSTGDKGVMALAVRKDTASAVAGTDGDYIPLIVDSSGRLHVTNAAVYAEDAAHTSTDNLIPAGVVRKDTATQVAGTDGDYSLLVNDSAGRLHVALSAVTFAEDAASTAADPGVHVLTRRTDTAAATSGTDGDYQPFITDANGRLHVIDPGAATVASAVFAEDAAHTTADKGIPAFTIRRDTPSASAGTTGDYQPATTDANGKLWVSDPHDVVSVTPTIGTSQHAAGDAVGGLQTFSAVCLVSGGQVVLDDLFVIDTGAESAVLDILFFNAEPSAATITDDEPFVLSTDTAKLIGRVSIAEADWVEIDGCDTAHLSGLGKILEANGSTSLYAAVVLRSGTPTWAVGDLIFRYGFKRK